MLTSSAVSRITFFSSVSHLDRSTHWDSGMDEAEVSFLKGNLAYCTRTCGEVLK